ncbi:hypothetical protein [Jannaschia pohangensis]|uniref:Uncharacterized protein n=1 Tax=Jannaschia pohangensis TaxID=390807 RepID=A0A1I3JKF5_9RHOB|nr:hypothetical protein [Jannaschia pohangensis]SFI60654.1 hypothetical protein SAMN04488095_1348 [Jannaschia pohangensis]
MTATFDEGQVEKAAPDVACAHCDGSGRVAEPGPKPRNEDPWTVASTIVAIGVGFAVYEYLIMTVQFQADWHPFALAGMTGMAAGVVWRSALKLAIGGVTAVAVHQTLLERASDLGFWPTLGLAAGFGVVMLSIWRIVAVAASVTLILVCYKLLQDGITPEQLVDAMREQLPWFEPL